jgi:ribosomal protein S27E
MSSRVQCICGKILHKNLFCGAGVSVVVPEQFLDQDYATMTAEEFINGLIIKNDVMVKCSGCGRILIVHDSQGGAADAYLPDALTSHSSGHGFTMPLGIDGGHQEINVGATTLDNLPLLTSRQAYLALLEFLREEKQWADKDGRIDLLGLLCEMEPEPSGETADPGAADTFHECLLRVIDPEYSSPWNQ